MNKVKSITELKTPRGINKLKLDVKPGNQYRYWKINLKGEISLDRILKIQVALGLIKQKDYKAFMKLTGEDLLKWGFKKYGIPLKS